MKPKVRVTELVILTWGNGKYREMYNQFKLLVENKNIQHTSIHV